MRTKETQPASTLTKDPSPSWPCAGTIAKRQPYKEWLSSSLRSLSDLGESTFLTEPSMDAASLLRAQAAAGMGAEDAQMVVEAMAQVSRGGLPVVEGWLANAQERLRGWSGQVVCVDVVAAHSG